MVFIYIQSLEDEKFYIGMIRFYTSSTSSGDDFPIEHSSNCEWTKMYKPKEIIESFTDVDVYDHDKITLMCMEKYGIENVRGGSFSNVNLSSSQFEIIQRMIRYAKNYCFTCGRLDHHEKSCHEWKWRQFCNQCFQCYDIPPHSYKTCPRRHSSSTSRDKYYSQSPFHKFYTKQQLFDFDKFIKSKNESNEVNQTIKKAKPPSFFSSMLTRIQNLF